jgi:protocadherin Fat 4
VVRVAKNLNYERKSRYILTVRAEDCAGGLLLLNSGEDSSVRFDTASIVITVADINDNPPTFLDSPYLAYVMENVVPPPNGYVLTVRAYDADTPPFNGQVRYFIKEGDADLFRINASTGEITLLRALDRETQAEYILTLVAMDTGKYFNNFYFASVTFLPCSLFVFFAYPSRQYPLPYMVIQHFPGWVKGDANRISPDMS